MPNKVLLWNRAARTAWMWRHSWLELLRRKRLRQDTILSTLPLHHRSNTQPQSSSSAKQPPPRIVQPDPAQMPSTLPPLVDSHPVLTNNLRLSSELRHTDSILYIYICHIYITTSYIYISFVFMYILSCCIRIHTSMCLNISVGVNAKFFIYLYIHTYVHIYIYIYIYIVFFLFST